MTFKNNIVLSEEPHVHHFHYYILKQFKKKHEQVVVDSALPVLTSVREKVSKLQEKYFY